MAQLIKMQDYISRYEQDIYRYPTQFARLKKQQWDKLKRTAYEAGELDRLYSEHAESETQVKFDTPREESKGLFKKVKGIFPRTGKQDAKADELLIPNQIENTNVFSLRFPFRPASLDELKQNFLNQLLRFQMKWEVLRFMKSHLWTNHSFWMKGSAFFCNVFRIRFSYYINLSFY